MKREIHDVSTQGAEVLGLNTVYNKWNLLFSTIKTL